MKINKLQLDDSIKLQASSLLRTQALKETYLSCLSRLSKIGLTLRQVVNELIDGGATRGDLICWAVEAGHNKRTIGTLISKLLCGKGRRQRKSGGGRKTNPDVLAIAEAVCANFGYHQAGKLLRAASRVAAAIAEAARVLPPESVPSNLPDHSSFALKIKAPGSHAKFPPLIVVNNKNAVAAVN